MALRGLRRIPSLRTIVARKRKRIKYSDYKPAQTIPAPVIQGSKQ